MAFQTISTAPKDGSEILLWKSGWGEAPRAKWIMRDGEDKDDRPTSFGGWSLANDWNSYGCEDGFLGWNEDIEDGNMPTHWSPIP